MSNFTEQLCQFITSSDLFPVPVKSAVNSYLTAWCDQNLSNRALNALTVLVSTTEIYYPFTNGNYMTSVSDLIHVILHFSRANIN